MAHALLLFVSILAAAVAAPVVLADAAKAPQVVQAVKAPVPPVAGDAGRPQPPAAANQPQGRTCLAPGQARALTQAGKIVPYVAALKAARAAAGGEMIDSRLCPTAANRLEYIVTVLGPDGRVRRVTVDAASGAVTRQH